jgi:hypothetical protein
MLFSPSCKQWKCPKTEGWISILFRVVCQAVLPTARAFYPKCVSSWGSLGHTTKRILNLYWARKNTLDHLILLAVKYCSTVWPVGWAKWRKVDRYVVLDGILQATNWVLCWLCRGGLEFKRGNLEQEVMATRNLVLPTFYFSFFFNTTTSMYMTLTTLSGRSIADQWLNRLQLF